LTDRRQRSAKRRNGANFTSRLTKPVSQRLAAGIASSMRLVVDTGIHSKGWSRDQAIDYMLSHSGMSKTDATAEVERYIAIPSQALAYKIGQLTITRLREKAKAELGDKFDIREFHAQVLDTGALPLPVLAEKIDAWIASKKAS
jgi:uncharacterized protein (DUF885 family)